MNRRMVTIDGNTIVWEWGPMWAEMYWSFDIVVQISDTVESGDVLTNRIELYGDSPYDVEYDWTNNAFELPVTILAPRFEKLSRDARSVATSQPSSAARRGGPSFKTVVSTTSRAISNETASWSAASNSGS